MFSRIPASSSTTRIPGLRLGSEGALELFIARSQLHFRGGHSHCQGNLTNGSPGLVTPGGVTAAGCFGRKTVKVEPLPTSDRTVMSPPWLATKLRLIARPKPVPSPFFFVV